MPRVVVSFKNTEEELALYKEIMKASDRSAYVKDILKAYKRMTEPKPSTEIIPVKRLVRVRMSSTPNKGTECNLHKTQVEEDVIVQPKVEEVSQQESKIEEVTKVETSKVEDIKAEETKVNESSVVEEVNKKEPAKNPTPKKQHKPRLISYDY